MGRQVNFYMIAEDEKAFLDFAKGTGDVVVLPWKSKDKSFPPATDFDTQLHAKSGSKYLLFNRSISSNLIIKHLPKIDMFTIDELESSVVEFVRSSVKGGTMRPGRIWAQFTRISHDENRLVPKETAFEAWYETLASWIRKRFKSVERRVYASPSALRLKEQGIKFREF